MKSPRLWLKSAVAPLISTGSEWLQRHGFYRMAEKLGGYGPTWSGESVTGHSALSHSVVWACVRRISGALGAIPLNLMQVVNGDKRYAADHPAYSMAHDAPNAEMGSMEFRETLTGHLLMHGNCFAQVIRRRGKGEEAFELWPLTPESVKVDREKESQRRLVYIVKDGNSAEKTFTVERGKPQDILHIRGLGYDGMRGYSVIDMARQSIGNAQAVEKYAGRFFASGGRQPGHIELERKMATDQDMANFKADLRKFVQNPDTAHEYPVYEPGQKFVPGGFSPEQSQFLETRQWTPTDICRWFELSPHMVGDLTHATFSNIEHLSLDFVIYCLMAWLKKWEEALRRCVLTPDEQRAGYYFKFNVNALLRGDFASRSAWYSTMLQNGPFCIDDVLGLEDMNPLPGGIGKDHRVQLNMQVVGQPPPVLTAGQKSVMQEDQIQQLITSLSQTLSQLQLKESIQ